MGNLVTLLPTRVKGACCLDRNGHIMLVIRDAQGREYQVHADRAAWSAQTSHQMWSAEVEVEFYREKIPKGVDVFSRINGGIADVLIQDAQGVVQRVRVQMVDSNLARDSIVIHGTV